MKRFAFALVFAAIAMVAPRVEAREFYKTVSTLELTYTSLETGTENVFALPFEVRFSDDGKFCQLNVSHQRLNCWLEEPNGYGLYQRNFFLDRNQWIALFQGLAHDGVLPLTYFEKLNRIFNQYAVDKANFYLGDYRQTRRIQVHDGQPEAFHIQLAIPSKPVVL